MPTDKVYPFKVTLYKYSRREWEEKGSEEFTTREAAIARRDILNMREFGQIKAGLDHYCVRMLDPTGQYQEIECGFIHPTRNENVSDITCDCADNCLTHIKISENNLIAATGKDWRFISNLCKTGPGKDFRLIEERPGYKVYEASPELSEENGLE